MGGNPVDTILFQKGLFEFWTWGGPEMNAPDSLQPSERVAPTSFLYFFLHIYSLSASLSIFTLIVTGHYAALSVFSRPSPPKFHLWAPLKSLFKIM